MEWYSSPKSSIPNKTASLNTPKPTSILNVKGNIKAKLKPDMNIKISFFDSMLFFIFITKHNIRRKIKILKKK